MIEKPYSIVDAGDMTSLQTKENSSQQHVGCKIYSTRKGTTKSVAGATVTNEVSISLHPHDRALLCCAGYVVVLF